VQLLRDTTWKVGLGRAVLPWPRVRPQLVIRMIRAFTASALGQQSTLPSHLHLCFSLTTSEFCWRSPEGRKAETRSTTYPPVYRCGSEPRRALSTELPV
jgi:hypothetical protein